MTTQTAPLAGALIQSIPLSALLLSPRNVRKTGGDQIDQLAASIEAHGLLQNLTVIRAGEKFEVIAGGRRLRALQALQKLGKRKAEDPVNCVVVPDAGAHEISLAENTIREAMHPADQFEAFQGLLQAGLDESEVAARFGVTVLFVRQRLKLAKVSPKVLAAYRAGKLSLEAVEAYAVSNDQARQERALKAGAVHAHHIRRVLTQGEIEASDKRVRFVTLAAYEAAGGAVRHDMFDAENPGYVADAQLLDKLTAEGLEQRAVKLRAEGWAFVEVGADLDTWKYPRTESKDKAKAGALITLRHNGELEIVRGVLKPGQRASTSSGRKAAKAKPARKPGALSFAQVQQLQAYRDPAIALHLAQHPRHALAALAASLARAVVDRFGDGVDSLVRFNRGNTSADRVPLALRDQVKASPASKALAKLAGEILAKLPKGRGEASLFAWLLTQPEATTHQLLALCTAQAFNAIQLYERAGGDPGLQFARLIGLDMAAHWRPSPAWLAQQPRAYLEHAVAEAKGKAGALELSTCKGKAQVVAKAAQHLVPKGEAAAHWLPAPLRTSSSSSPAKPAKKAAAKRKAPAKAPAKKATPARKRGAK